MRKELDDLSKYGVKIFVFEKRKGKATEVNEVVAKLNTDILVFFDSDLRIKKIDIKKIVDACEKYDLVEFYKEIDPICFLGKFVRVEFLSYYACYQYVSSKIGKSIFMNGAGFAIRKELWDKLGGYRRVITEDIDLAIRIYKLGGSYFLLNEVAVEIQPICSIRKWLDQRKRWSSGFVEVLFDHFKTFIEFFAKHPILLLLYSTVINPAILAFVLLSFLFPQNLLYKLSLSLLILLSAKISPILLFVIPTAIVTSIIFNFIFFCLTILFVLISYELVYYKLSKQFMNPLWVIGFAMFYSPLFLFLVISTLFYYLIFERFPSFNWKV